MNDPFIMSQKEIRGKKVVTIGHFPYLEKLFEPICELAIIEREPDINGIILLRRRITCCRIATLPT